MDWNEVKMSYPDRWLVIEAVKAYSQDAVRRVELVDSMFEIDLSQQDSFHPM